MLSRLAMSSRHLPCQPTCCWCVCRITLIQLDAVVGVTWGALVFWGLMYWFYFKPMYEMDDLER